MGDPAVSLTPMQAEYQSQVLRGLGAPSVTVRDPLEQVCQESVELRERIERALMEAKAVYERREKP